MSLSTLFTHNCQTLRTHLLVRVYGLFDHWFMADGVASFSHSLSLSHSLLFSSTFFFGFTFALYTVVLPIWWNKSWPFGSWLATIVVLNDIYISLMLITFKCLYFFFTHSRSLVRSNDDVRPIYDPKRTSAIKLNYLAHHELLIWKRTNSQT